MSKEVFDAISAAAVAAGLNLSNAELNATAARINAALDAAALALGRPFSPVVRAATVRDPAAEPVSFNLTVTLEASP